MRKYAVVLKYRDKFLTNYKPMFICVLLNI